MGINQLLRAHQAEARRASNAQDEQSQQRHFDKVANYANRIRELRQLPRDDARDVGDETNPVIVEDFTVANHASLLCPERLESCEDEGGALASPSSQSPVGVSLTICQEYQVGPYASPKLPIAVAESDRQKVCQNSYEPGANNE